MKGRRYEKKFMNQSTCYSFFLISLLSPTHIHSRRQNVVTSSVRAWTKKKSVRWKVSILHVVAIMKKTFNIKKYVYGFCIECCCCLWKCKVFFINIAHVKCHSKCNFSFYIFLNWKVKFNRKREKMFNFQFSIKNKILFLHTEKVTTLIFWEIYSWKKNQY